MGLRPDAGDYRLVRFEDTPEVGGADVLDFWQREDALPAGKDGRDRLHEVSVIALDGGGRVAAVSTAFVRRNERLRSEMWHLRVFVGRDHRGSPLAALIVAENSKHLEDRFAAGDETRAPGLLMEIENLEQKSARTDAVWAADWAPRIRFTFIGENERGDHVRVHWFAGARIA